MSKEHVPIGVDALYAYRDQLNRMNFNREFGWQWIVSRMDMPDGSVRYSLDRRNTPETRAWKPEPELEGMRVGVRTKAMADG